jgi:hypothetical protein
MIVQNDAASLDAGPGPTTYTSRATARAYLPLATAGFRRYATYRQATVAATVTNSIFGFLRCAILFAVVDAGSRVVAGYDEPRRCFLDEPLAAPLVLPGMTVESVTADGRRITYALDGVVITAGKVVRRLTEVAALRDISLREPDIEDVVARLYARRPGA